MHIIILYIIRLTCRSRCQSRGRGTKPSGDLPARFSLSLTRNYCWRRTLDDLKLWRWTTQIYDILSGQRVWIWMGIKCRARDSEDVPKSSSNVHMDSKDVPKTSPNVRRDSEDVPQMVVQHGSGFRRRVGKT